MIQATTTKLQTAQLRLGCSQVSLTGSYRAPRQATSEGSRKGNPQTGWFGSAVGRSSANRYGFTLVEVLVVIVIIGILVGLLVPGVMSASRRSREFAIESEMAQLAGALEEFKTKYGFYPPDFTAITTVDQFLPFLNRIAPNHSESANLATWWTEVGQKLSQAGPQASYVFWLSGLAKNKQFPLTGGTGTPLPAFNLGAVEREVFFEFRSDRLYDPETLNLSGNSTNKIATYSQFSGSCQPFVYFEVKRLAGTTLTLPVNISSYATVKTSGGDCRVFPYFVVRGSQTEFMNKDKFQLITAGLDSRFGADVPTPYRNSPNLSGDVTPRDRDNLTNFSEGRLELSLLSGN